MSEETEKKRRNHHVDRITLSADSLSKISAILDYAHTNIPGIKITKSDFVNWLIARQDVAPGASELKSLYDNFYDELKFNHWAVARYKDARAKGESVRLQDIIRDNIAKICGPTLEGSHIGNRRNGRKSKIRPSQIPSPDLPDGESRSEAAESSGPTVSRPRYETISM